MSVSAVSGASSDPPRRHSHSRPTSAPDPVEPHVGNQRDCRTSGSPVRVPVDLDALVETPEERAVAALRQAQWLELCLHQYTHHVYSGNTTYCYPPVLRHAAARSLAMAHAVSNRVDVSVMDDEVPYVTEMNGVPYN